METKLRSKVDYAGDIAIWIFMVFLPEIVMSGVVIGLWCYYLQHR